MDQKHKLKSENKSKKSKSKRAKKELQWAEQDAEKMAMVMQLVCW